MSTRLKLSPSKVSGWHTCPRAFLFRYIRKQRVPRLTWAHTNFGISIHNALRSWWELPVEDRRPEAIRAVMASAWIPAGYRDPEHSEEWRTRATAMTETYLSDVDPQQEPVSQERTLGFVTDTVVIEGRIDRIDERADRHVIVDYKTGRDIPTSDDVRSAEALALYALMVQRTLKKECSTVELHHIPSVTVVSWEHTEASLEEHLRRVESAAVDIRRAQDTLAAVDDAVIDEVVDDLFPPKPSGLCSYCDFLDLCPAGQRGHERARPWAAMRDAGD